MDEFEKPAQIFERKFSRVFREIDSLERKIHRRKGIIFTNHVYSIKELLELANNGKIVSIVGKIGDDAKNWHNQGKLSSSERDGYHKNKLKTDELLHEVSEKIKSREPTWWESFKGSMEEFVALVMEKLPELKTALTLTTEVLARLPGTIGRVGAIMKEKLEKFTNTLPGKNNKKIGHD